MSLNFFTNQKENTLYNKFEGIFTHNKNIDCFDALVGYFRASGYFKIRPLLDNINPIRILVGIDIDIISSDMQRLGTLFNRATTADAQKDWEQQFLQDVAQARYDQETEEGIKQFVEDIKANKVYIKAHPSQNIHAKIYILRPENFNEHNSGHVITGSSNLTEAGLGTKPTSNYEFNVLLNDYSDVKFATDEFERLWAEGIEISADFVSKTIPKTHSTRHHPLRTILKNTN